MLLAGGADATAQDKDGHSPLHLASSEGHVEVIPVLFVGCADATAQDKDGQSPWHRAVSQGHLHVAHVLQYNADHAPHTMT